MKFMNMNKKGNPRKLFVHTFGCQMNEYDSRKLIRLLSLKAFEPVEKPDKADVIFVNTCSVRSKAEQKLYSFLGRLKRVKQKNSKVLIVVGGCVAEQVKDDLLNRFSHVDIVAGTRSIESLPALIEEALNTSNFTPCTFFTEKEETSNLDWLDPSCRFWKSSIVESVTIMQGCDNFCSYCVVPYVRGRERSRHLKEIIREIQALHMKGAKEILLLGQNVNSYGKGLDPPVTFTQLIRKIAEETNIERLRFTTSHPKDLTEDLMASFRDIAILCPHLHIPFQAGSDRILSLMKRGYTQKEYLSKIDRLRHYRPDIALTADVMVGFPSEREEDFRETMKVIKTVEFDSLFSFQYSDRPFTEASKMEPKVDDAVKNRWLSELQAFQAEKTLLKNRQEEGNVREVLVEGISKIGDGQLMGRTIHNRIVNFKGFPHLVGKIVAVRIIEGYAHSLKGELLDQ